MSDESSLMENEKIKLIIEKVNNNIIIQIGLGVVIAFICIIFILIFKFILYRFNRNKKASPYLIKGTQSGKKTRIIYQDPDSDNSIPLVRSRDEKGGIEFSYSLWLNVNDWINYKTGQWKHVFHKGSSNSDPNIFEKTNNINSLIAAPGLWFHGETNSLRIYLNTFQNMNEYIDIENIPANKWFHLAIIVRETSLNLYVNGYLKEKHTLSSLPRQNFGNVYFGLNGGFDGSISNVKYYDYALSSAEISSSITNLPSTINCVNNSGNAPPYLNTNWWQNEYP
jgi:hypothetical protein